MFTEAPIELVLIDFAGRNQHAAKSGRGAILLHDERAMYARIVDVASGGQQRADGLAVWWFGSRKHHAQARPGRHGVNSILRPLGVRAWFGQWRFDHRGFPRTRRGRCAVRGIVGDRPSDICASTHIWGG